MKMKDEEFQKNLETILERFEKIDREVKQCLDQDKSNVSSQDCTNKLYADNLLDSKYEKDSREILDNKHYKKRIATENKY